MNTRKLLLATALGSSGLLFSSLVAPRVARAQSSTTGGVQGVVTDKKSGEKLAGVTVVVKSASTGGTQSALTDDNGFYKVGDLAPGDYSVTFFYADITVTQNGVNVGINKVTPVYQQLDQSQAGGEKIVVHAHAPTIDPTSTTQGITIDKNYIQNVPIPGRTFDATLGAAAGSQGDALGVSFSGSSSLENQYYVDGVNTTGLTYGTVGSPVINDFIQEIEVITGGYNAEYGRATGGVVNVVTKSGSNEFKGSVWGYYQPALLTAAAITTPINASSIDITPNQNYKADFGFELGGPIVKDKAWFWVGFDPQLQQTDYLRTVKSETDCRVVADPANGVPAGNIPGLSVCDKKYADGVPDLDPRTGFYLTDNVDNEIRSQTSQAYSILGKVNYAPTPEHQGQISFQALPATLRQPGLFGAANSGGGYIGTELTTDVSAKWTSKFNDGKTEIEAVVGWHRDQLNSTALDPSLEDKPLETLYDGSLNQWGPAFGESNKVNSYGGCKDNQVPTSQDPYPFITNCPMGTNEPYYIGGPGPINHDTEERREAKISLTERLKAAGTHEIKAGIDGEDNLRNKARLYSGNPSTLGGVFLQNDVGGGAVYLDRWVELTNMNNTDKFFNQMCLTPNPNGASGPGGGGTLSFKCAYLGGTLGSRGTQIQGETTDWAAYLRDSWQIMPNLTFNYGLRYEEQRMRYASFLQNTIDPLTSDRLGTNAMSLTGNWAPRIGLLYDWTKQGRSKIYINYGRYFEDVPMDINDRSFGGEVTYEQAFSTKSNYGRQPDGSEGQCGDAKANQAPQIGGPDAIGCAMVPSAVGDLKNDLIGASGVLVAPGIQSQYLDEVVGGFEYELIDDLKIGVSFQDRRLGRVIEDVSTDGANTYIIANPGEFSSQEETNLENLIGRTTDPAQKAHLQHELSLYQGIRIFDKPQRIYDALQFTLTRRFSKQLYVQASYTYSRTVGNYPGLFSSNNGQVDPNISSQFDLIELLSNHFGPLPQDRPHYIKLDGYYTFDFHKIGALTVGARFRASSGIPEDALAGHYLYGPDESFLLPRGELGRTPFDTELDLHAGFGRTLRRNMKLELLLDVYNVYDNQTAAEVDDTYAPYYRLSGPNTVGEQENANPVSGGTYQDLIWVKTIDQSGAESNKPIGRNPNFHNPAVRYAPTYAQLGVRLTF